MCSAQNLAENKKNGGDISPASLVFRMYDVSPSVRPLIRDSFETAGVKRNSITHDASGVHEGLNVRAICMKA